jgi:hypothetical protein
VTPHTGAIPSAGPAGFGGMRGPGGMRGGPGGLGVNRQGGVGGPGVPPSGGSGFPNGTGSRNGTGTNGTTPNGTTPNGTGNRARSGGGPGGMGGPGGLLGSPTPSIELTVLLKQDATSYTWVAATVGSNNAAGYQLAAGSPVMAVGGFNGTDPAPTLAQFQALVAAKKIHYFVGGEPAVGGRGGSTSTGGSADATKIAQWVQADFTATTVGGTTVYDLTASAS